MSAPLSRDHGGLSITTWTMPFAAVLGWWSLCFVLYLVGWPIRYTHVNVGWVSLLVVCSAIAGWLGYAVAEKVPARASRLASAMPWVPFAGLALLLLLFVPVNQAYSGFGPTQLLVALRDQATAYLLSSQKIAEGLGARGPLVVAQALAAPLTLTALPYFAYSYFTRRKHLVPLAICVALPVLNSILIGRDQQLGLTAVTLVTTYALARVVQDRPLVRRDYLWLSGAAVVLVVGIALRKLSRVGGDVPCAPGQADCSGVIRDASLWDAMSVTLSSYLTQGFEGLGHAMDAVWSFGFGYSHSPALVTLLGLPHRDGMPPVTYQLDALGWSTTGYWSTGLASWANDVPWVLVPILVAGQFLLLGLAWAQCRASADWLSLSVLAYTAVALLYMPQNLQLAVSGPLYVGYLVLVGLFLGRWLPWSGGKRRGRASSS